MTHAFFQRRYPSANSVLLRGPLPVLVDTGFGSDADALEHWLRAQDVAPERLSLIVNTHHHSDHVGGNFRLQSRYGTLIAAHPVEAALVNARHPEACRARWLDQPVEPYQVQRPLSEGDVIDTGAVRWEVLHTPGHTRGHISLYARSEQLLLLGDALHGNDVGWLNPYKEGGDALQRSIAVTERLAALNIRTAYSGHGAAIEDFSRVAQSALRRLRRWTEDSRAPAWHASKRILAHALIVNGGMTKEALQRDLCAAPWLRDYARHAFGQTAEGFLPSLIPEMLRAGAAEWRDGRLTASARSAAPVAGWQTAPGFPDQWPPLKLPGGGWPPPNRHGILASTPACEGKMGSTVRLSAADGRSLPAYVAEPDDAAWGLVVVQEIFGVNDHIRRVCETFAAQGYAAVAPALFDRVQSGVELGYGQEDVARGRELRGKLKESEVLADIEAAADRLPGKKLGIVGYCFGGTVAWWAATRPDRFAAASCWYSGGIAEARTERPRCPVQMHFGEQDASIPLSDVDAIRAAQPDVEIFVYPGAKHGFGCQARESFSKPSYELAQQRTLAFLARHLR